MEISWNRRTFTILWNGLNYISRKSGKNGIEKHVFTAGYQYRKADINDISDFIITVFLSRLNTSNGYNKHY